MEQTLKTSFVQGQGHVAKEGHPECFDPTSHSSRAEGRMCCSSHLSAHMDMGKVARKPWKSSFPATVATPQFSLELRFKPGCCPWPHTSLFLSIHGAYPAWVQGRTLN